MAGYLVANITITDPVAFERYRVAVAPMIAAFGGRYLVRGGKMEVMEGDVGAERLVVVEFPSIEAARAFYTSPDYAPLIALRSAATQSNLVLVEGYAP
jgi:uncharacterized protein (DUF1330 family)